MTSSSFKYDVAFSFLAQDEALAQHLGASLSERYSIFVYSERQKELVGKDGLEQFSSVFRKESRVCVMLYRNGWGTTKWTRVEETAIKDRAFDDGWDFLLVVSLDGSAPPAWLPKTKIWLGYERFGAEAAIGAIDARVQETGGIIKEESARERAQRLKQESQREAERRATLNSESGVRLAHDEFEKLAGYLKAEAEAIASSDFPIQFGRARDRVMYIRSPRRSITFGWSQQYSNSLRYSSMLIRVLAGAYHPDGWGEGPKELSTASIRFDLDSAGEPGWREEGSTQLLSSRALAEKYLGVVVEGTYQAYLDREYDE